MPRTKGAQDIQGWRAHGMTRDIAANDLNMEQIAEKYDVALQTVYAYKERHQAEIAAVLADWSDEFADLWSVRKHNRIAELQDAYAGVMARLYELLEEAERATEEMRLIDSNAAKVLVPGAEWRGYTRERARLLREISEEMGQLPSRNPQEAEPVHNPLMDAAEIAQDEAGNWFIIK